MPAHCLPETAGIHSAVIPAAGLGTRLRPLTHAIPKELLPVGPRPVLAQVVEELCAAGITRILLVVSPQKPQIKHYFDRASAEELFGRNLPDRPLRFDYAVQETQKGLGDALLCAEEWAGNEPFVVALGDCLIESPEPGEPLCRLLRCFAEQNAGAAVLTERVPLQNVSKYGILAPNAEYSLMSGAPFEVAQFVEKPTPAEAPADFAVAARYLLRPTIFAALRESSLDIRGELNVTDALRAQMRQGKPLWAVPLQDQEFRRDIGNLKSYVLEFVRSALNDPVFGTEARSVAAELLNVRQNDRHNQAN